MISAVGSARVSCCDRRSYYNRSILGMITGFTVLHQRPISLRELKLIVDDCLPAQRLSSLIQNFFLSHHGLVALPCGC